MQTANPWNSENLHVLSHAINRLACESLVEDLEEDGKALFTADQIRQTKPINCNQIKTSINLLHIFLQINCLLENIQASINFCKKL